MSYTKSCCGGGIVVVLWMCGRGVVDVVLWRCCMLVVVAAWRCCMVVVAAWRCCVAVLHGGGGVVVVAQGCCRAESRSGQAGCRCVLKGCLSASLLTNHLIGTLRQQLLA